jgi:hypothetical protein
MPHQSVCERRYRRNRREGDYGAAIARNQRTAPDSCKYEVALHFVQLSEDRKREEAVLSESFKGLVSRWKDETGHLSSTTKRIAHPSYLRIIGLARKSSGYQLEKLLLEELQNEPDEWFDALAAVTGEDPVALDHDFDQATAAWLEWGRKKGIV